MDFTQPASITISSVVNAASFSPGPNGSVAPGEIVTIFGDGFGAQPTINFSGLSAAVVYASNCQINAVVPFGTQAQVSTFLTVQSGSQTLGPIKLPVTPAQPGIFTLDGTGHSQAAVIKSGRHDQLGFPSRTAWLHHCDVPDRRRSFHTDPKPRRKCRVGRRKYVFAGQARVSWQGFFR